MGIEKIQIADGCISCNLCEDLCPEVFSVPPGETSQVAREWKRFRDSHREQIEEAFEFCPVEVIKVEKHG